MAEIGRWDMLRQMCADQGWDAERTERIVAEAQADQEKANAFYATAPPVEIVCRMYRRKGKVDGPRFVIKAHPLYIDDIFSWPEVTASGPKTHVLGEHLEIVFDDSMPPQPDDDPGVFRG